MQWIRVNSNHQCAVGGDGTIYAAKADGSLEARGERWKQCPVDMQSGQCKRPGRVRPPEKCRQCSYSPVVARMGNMDAAMRMAEAINRKIEMEL